jgi:hypothetical protein
MVYAVRSPSSDLSELGCVEVFGTKKEAKERAIWIRDNDFPQWEVIYLPNGAQPFRDFIGQDKIIVDQMESFQLYDSVQM